MKSLAWTRFFFLLVASVLSFLQAAGAETNSATFSSGSTNPSTDLLMVFVRMLGALLLVVALLVGGAWLFKRSRFFALYQGGPTRLKVIESRSLGARTSLMVVGYSQQRFLIAVSATGTTVLSTLPDAPADEGTASKTSSFAEHLTGFEGRKT